MYSVFMVGGYIFSGSISAIFIVQPMSLFVVSLRKEFALYEQILSLKRRLYFEIVLSDREAYNGKS